MQSKIKDWWHFWMCVRCTATGVRTQLPCLGLNLPPSCRSQPDASAAQCCRSDDAFRADGAWLPFSSSALLFGAARHWRRFLKFPANPKGPTQSTGGSIRQDQDRDGVILQRKRDRDAPVASTDPEHLLCLRPSNALPQLRQATPAVWNDVTV